jgi:alpha-amylase/alpha-mannosidase (GH57 family)
MERYICIHGHFYQPPRENPWLEAIELQDSAYPYHDWNEKITAECYATNATSRVLEEKNRIVQMVNNYSRISFNFGPTLLAWLEEKAPDVYGAILDADRESQKIFSGHGSALAQAYNHMILPLANSRDKYTQIVWGIQDFEHRFERKPEGMWLPETAVDLETLDILSEQGILFTILAPHQARQVRPIGDGKWQDVSGGNIDPTMAYTLRLPSGRTIVLFFYDGPISRAVAFERLLRSGELFAQRLMGGFSDTRTWPQIVNIATDGETYGHHHRFGDMALAYALNYIESKNLARLTNYGEYLEKHPPTHEVEIVEKTSWSCPHGVERWQSDCGCNTGGQPEWNQAWRAPLREALDWLRDTLAPAYEEKARSYLKDPWEGRNSYIHIVFDRSPEGIEGFFNQHALQMLDENETILALKLLELQRHAMLMYTSCGWFFDDLSGIETVQIIQYAGRAVQLAQEIFGDDVEQQFLEHLEKAKSNMAEHQDGRHIYKKFVEPSMLDLKKVGAHYAISSVFEDYSEQTSIYCYSIAQEDYQSSDAGRVKLVMGRAKVACEITRESALLCFGVLHLGDHILSCGVRKFQGQEAYQTMVEELSDVFASGDFPDTIRFMDKHFGASTYSIKALFRDEQRKVLNLILETTLKDAEVIYRQLYENHAPMMRFLKELGIPPPKVLYSAAEVVLNASLCRSFEEEALDPESIQNYLQEAKEEGISLEKDRLEYVFRHNLERIAQWFFANPKEIPILQDLETAVTLLNLFPFQVNVWKVQNIFYEILQAVYPEFREKAQQDDEKAREWVNLFRIIGERLWVRVE